MYRIIEKRKLTPDITLISVEALLIAKKAKAGQFIILRPFKGSERIPLTIAANNAENGTVTVIYQKIGKTTKELDLIPEGGFLQDFTGPLGNPTEIEGIKKAAVVGGGLGSAIALPVAAELHEAGAEVHMIAGFRTQDLIILENEMKAASDGLFLCTDDGSNGKKGFVTDVLKELIENGEKYDCVFAAGPIPMMKFVSLLTKQYGIKTVVSLNPIMIDGTGMCGGCRVTIGGKIKFACVDGPDFDGHEVDFDELMRRNSAYREFEQQKLHQCRLEGMENG